MSRHTDFLLSDRLYLMFRKLIPARLSKAFVRDEFITVIDAFTERFCIVSHIICQLMQIPMQIAASLVNYQRYWDNEGRFAASDFL